MYFPAGVRRNLQPVMYRVRGARRNQMDVNHRARSPSVALVDRVAMPVDLQRTVKMRAGVYRTFSIIFGTATPENCVARIINSF